MATKSTQTSRAELPAVEWLERYGRPEDQPVAQFLREHSERIEGWLRDARRTLAGVLTPADRDDLLQVALLAVVEVVRGGGDLKHVKNQLQNAARRQKAFAGRRTYRPEGEEEVDAGDLPNGEELLRVKEKVQRLRTPARQDRPAGQSRRSETAEAA